MDPGRTSLPRSRQNSATATPKPGLDIKPAKDIHSTSSTSKSHYTVFVRLPFPRNDFQDPPPVEWDSIKDKALWKLISAASNSRELNWEEMSTRFGVSLNFLLQQAAWLYERHFDAMRAQMKKLNVPSAAASGTATPAPDGGGGVRLDGGPVVGGVGMARTGSKDSRPPTSATMQRRSSLQQGEPDSTPATPRSARHAFSRTPSTNTVTQSRYPPSPKHSNRPASGTVAKSATPSLPKESSQDSGKASGLGIAGSSESDSEQEASVVRNQAFRKSPFSKKPPTREAGSDADADEDDEEDSSGGSLPFATASTKVSNDPAATLRNSPNSKHATPMLTSPGKAKSKVPAPVDSSKEKSTAPSYEPNSNHRSEPLGPKQRAELEKLSPRYKKPGGESSPSIGSSFSDLDDASVTQSALEDALLSNMQYGSIGMGAGSRMSSLRDALGRQ